MHALAALYSLIPSVLSWQYAFVPSDSDECHESCFTTTVDAFQTVKSPIWFSQSPTDSFERAKLSGVNDTAFEQWYFEAVSEAGDAFIVAFGRDPSYKPLGYGVLPFEMMFVFANGTRHALTDFAVESRIQDCCGQVQGQWNTKTGSVSWWVSENLKTATVEFDTLSVQGKATLRSFTPARYPDGSLWPSRSAQTQISPHLHFVESIPAAHAEVDFNVQGSQLTFSGLGGHFHNWAAFDWFTILNGWQNMRAAVGPFAFSLWNPVSRTAGGIEYQSAILFRDGNPILEVYGPKDHTLNQRAEVTIRRKFGGSIHGALDDESSGWIVEFSDPRTAKTWRFNSTHVVLAHEVGLGQGCGLSVFTDMVQGGEHDGDVYSGYGISEQVALPEAIGASAAWKVFKTHRDNAGLATWQALWKIVRAAVAQAVRL